MFVKAVLALLNVKRISYIVLMEKVSASRKEKVVFAEDVLFMQNKD